MQQETFETTLLQITDQLCTDIDQVYHLGYDGAKTALSHTYFYRCLEDKNTGLWNKDSRTLFLLYQDEIEYGKLVTLE